MLRHSVMQQINGSFNAVSPDMKLEQSIQRCQKKCPRYHCPDIKTQSMQLNGRLHITRYCKLMMFSAPLLVQILGHVNHNSIMNWLETTQKFTAPSCTTYMNVWREEETHMTQWKIITESFIILQKEQWYYNPQQKTSLFLWSQKREYIEFRKNCFFPRILSSSVKLIYMPNSANHLNNKKKTKTKPAEISTKQLSVFHKWFKAALSLFILIAEINSRIYLQ